MKRNAVILFILSLLIFSSCIDQLLPPAADISSDTEQASGKGDLNIKVFIPDYQKMAEQNGERVIAPQTTKIRLSLANGANTFIQYGDLLQLNVNSITSVPNAPSSLPGGTWNGTFLAMECKTYTAGTIKIELLDLNNKVITSGVNQADVVITKGQAAQAVFFTTPEIFNGILGSLSKGEMRFWRVTMMGGYSYKLTVNAEGSYPDIVVFNDNGTFKEYYSVSSGENSVINFKPTATESCYLGVWADSGAVTSYNVTMSYNFNNNIQDFSTGFNGWQALAQGTNAPMPVIVVDEGKSIIEFASASMSSGGRAILSRTYNLTEPALISFWYKTDIGGDQNNAKTFFKLYIDDQEKASYYGLGASWNYESFIVPAGSHSLKFVLEKDGNYQFSVPRTNKVWIRDISFTPDVTAFINIEPRGPKDTYVGGFQIQYTAEPLRSDGSQISEVNVVYSGTGVDPATGIFTPTAPGTYTVTASAGGITAKSNIITVHPADYLRRPYTNPITGKTYNGYKGVPGILNMHSGKINFNYPAEKNISADGFVTFDGESKFTEKIYAFLDKEGDSSLRTWYEIQPGKFTLRVWLRFGPGKYLMYFCYESDPFTITNTCADMGVDGDPRFKYPSSVVQSDDFRITNLLTDMLYGVSKEADRIRRIHNYLVQNTVYDTASLTGVRKPQDALSVLGTRYHIDSQYEPLGGHFLAVCDGYSSATAALLRAAGIETKYIISESMNHAWNNVYTGGSWKFLDVTWNDPISSGSYTDRGPFFVGNDYYLLTTMDGKNGDHYGGVADNFRSINPVPSLPKMRGMPDGWY